MKERQDLQQLRLRHQIEKAMDKLGATRHGAGTDLTNGVMDISFSYHGIRYVLELSKRQIVRK